PALREALKDRKRSVCREAAEALGRIARAGGLSATEAEDIVLALAARLKTSDATLHQLVVEALGDVGPGAGRGAPTLGKGVQDIDDEARFAAAHAGGEVGAEAALPALALRRALADPDEEMRPWAAHALGGPGPAAASSVEDLLAAMSDPHRDVREGAARSL